MFCLHSISLPDGLIKANNVVFSFAYFRFSFLDSYVMVNCFKTNCFISFQGITETAFTQCRHPGGGYLTREVTGVCGKPFNTLYPVA